MFSSTVVRVALSTTGFVAGAVVRMPDCFGE